jgi:beta-lactamase regulating signal transducer with metallopeptidase domain
MFHLMIASANSAGDRWAGWVLAASLDAGLLLAVIGLVWFAIRDRVAPQVGYCLFLLVPLKLLMPVVVTVPAPIAQWAPSSLASSWFKRTAWAETFESQRPVRGQVTALEMDEPALDGPSVAQRSRTLPVVADGHQPDAPARARSAWPVRPAARSSVDTVTQEPRLSASGTLFLGWLVAVLVLLGWFAAAQRRFRARLKHISPLDVSGLAVDLGDLCRRAGTAPSIRLVECDRIAAPSVWGIARPTMILPQGICASLTAEQLQWVLLHELAHVRRHDLILVALQRFAGILHFFNPVAWIANRVITQLREYACDDVAVGLSDASAVESGEAFVRILRQAGAGARGLQGALGVFGLDSRACCLRRVRRLLDAERPIRTAPGLWSLWGLILLAIAAAPHLRAAGDATAPQEPPKESLTKKQAVPKADPNVSANPKGALASDGHEFELLVVGPGGKSIPEATVELAANPIPTAAEIKKGKFLRRESYRALVAADADGRIVVARRWGQTAFTVYITIPGYGPYWAGWTSTEHAEPIPRRFTAELEPAWSVGGIIVDADAKPVANVEIHPSIEFKKRPGELAQLHIGEKVMTDTAGRWRFDSVPVSMREVHAFIDHPKFSPIRRSLTRREFGIEPAREPSSRIVLERGLTVSGTVTDDSGKPIPGALVRTQSLNAIREAKTGPDGRYHLVGCEPRAVRIVVSAKGRALDMKELNIEPGMGPLDFQMKPGGTVRVRVLDEHGKPVPKARIFFQRWRGPISYFEFRHVNQYADESGVWVWHEAPLDELRADICPPGGMQLSEQPLIAREAEYVFRVPGVLVVSGNVTDAVTKEPIKEFRVVPGGRYNRDQMHWNRRESYVATGGHYEIRRTRGDFANLIRIEADGYQSAVSRDIKNDEGTIAIDFELKRGTNVAGKVVTPGNLAAAGAKVALGVAGSQIDVRNGDIDDRSTDCERVETDDAGRFHFSAQDKDFQLVITHSSGFAHITSTPDWELTRIIRLEPWCRVEGTFRIGKTTAANVPIALDVVGLGSYGRDVPSIFTQHEAITRADGRFVFERVLPGAGRIGRGITLFVKEGATEVTSSCKIAASFPAGKTVHIDLGGTGRPVLGKLLPPEGISEKVRWSFALVNVSPQAAGARAEGPYFTATVDRDGGFRIDDVPAGDYSLSAQFYQQGRGFLRDHRFTVPASDNNLAAPPVDLGTLKLENR